MARKNVTVGLVFGVCFLLAGGALAQPPENWTSGIAYEVCPSAKITKLSFYMGKTEAGPMLFYEVGIMNVSEKPVRFKLHIFPLDGDPISGMYPLMKRKDKPLALLPKEEMVMKWPVFAKGLPKGFALVVNEQQE